MHVWSKCGCCLVAGLAGLVAAAVNVPVELKEAKGLTISVHTKAVGSRV